MSEDVAYGIRLLSRPRRPQTSGLRPAAGGGEQQRDTDDRGEERGQQDRDLRLLRQQVGAGERQPGDEDRDGEADAGDRTEAEHHRPGGALGQLRDAEAYGQEGRGVDADRLAEDQPQDDAEADRFGEDLADRAQLDARVGEREDGKHDVRGHRVQRADEPLDHRHRLLEQEPQPGELVGVEVAVLQGAGGEIARDLLLEQRRRRGEQADRDAGQRGVHAGLEQGEPHADAEDRVDHDAPDPQHAGHDHQAEETEGDREPGQREVAGVEHRDHQDRADVVDDRERQQEQPRGRRDPPTQHAQHPDREGDVGRHRDAPAGTAVAARRVEREVDTGRHHHPADRRDDRQGRGARVAQVAVDQLVLDLQADDEEEDHHQGVVDPVLERLVEVQRTDVERQVGVPERVVRRRPRAVGPEQGGRGGEQQEDRAGRLDAEELAHRARDQPGQRPVAGAVDGPGPPEVVEAGAVGRRGHREVWSFRGWSKHHHRGQTRHGPTRLPGSPATQV